MPYKKINIGAATVLYDEDTGAILITPGAGFDIGESTDAKADIDGNGTVNAHLRRATTDLGALLALVLAHACRQNIFTATGTSPADVKNVPIVQAAAGVAPISADVTGHHVYLLGYQGTQAGNGTIQFQEVGGGVVFTGPMDLLSSGGFGLEVTGYPLAVTQSGKGFELDCQTNGWNGAVQILDITE